MEQDASQDAPPHSHSSDPSTAPTSIPQPLTPRRQLLDQQIASQTASTQGGAFAQLTSNPFFTAGFGLAILGGGITIARKAFLHGAALLRRRLLVDVEITRQDESYDWFLSWMTNYQRKQESAMRQSSLLAGDSKQTGSRHLGLFSRLIRAFVPGLHHLSIQTTSTRTPGGSTNTAFALVPGPGHHILRYGSAFIAVQREREKGPLDQTGRPFEAIKLTTLYAHRHVFQDLFLEAHDLARQANEGKTSIFTAWSTEWRPLGQPRRKRPLESVVLAEGVKERLIDDVKAFIEAREWYLDRGIPYRRGYLLYGAPGTGKSSFIQALAGEFDFNIAMLNLSERGLTDDRLMHLLINVPPRTIVVLEDADAAFTNRRAQTDEDGYRGANVTFSGLLNALDGVASAEERIVFLTTNHVDRLDAALVRPGRVDLTVCFGEATPWQIERLWDRFFSQQDPEGELKREYIDKLRALGILDRTSTAALQGHFLFNKDDPAGAVATVDHLLPRHEARRS